MSADGQRYQSVDGEEVAAELASRRQRLQSILIVRRDSVRRDQHVQINVRSSLRPSLKVRSRSSPVRGLVKQGAGIGKGLCHWFTGYYTDGGDSDVIPKNIENMPKNTVGTLGMAEEDRQNTERRRT